MVKRIVLSWGEHTFVYLFQPDQVDAVIRRVYVDSRHPELGFSLALVCQAMRMLKCQT